MTVTPLPSPAPNAQPVVGDVVAGKYCIERVLGEGGMGTVFAARHLVTEKRCALKWLRPERTGAAVLARFEQEARAAGRIHHPNVVAVYDVGEHGGAAFLVMELLEGLTLRARLDAGPMEVAEALELTVQATRGVAAAHAAGVLHRDLKPENLVITLGSRREPIVKVVDFGISKIEHDATAELVTRSGALIGTPLYMAPERLFGEPSDARADVYALGVMLYECLTGVLPYQAENAAALGRRFAKQTAVPRPSSLRPGLPALVDDVVMHALALSLSQRIQSAAQLSATLEEVLELIAEGESKGTVSYASAPMLGSAVQTTIDSTTGSGSAGVRRSDVVTMGSGTATTGDKKRRPRLRKWLIAAALIALATLGWFGLRVDGPISPVDAAPVDATPPKEATTAPAPEGSSRPASPAAAAPPATSLDAGVNAQLPVEPAQPAHALGRHEKRARHKPLVTPVAPTPEVESRPEASEVGRSKSQFAPKDFY